MRKKIEEVGEQEEKIRLGDCEEVDLIWCWRSVSGHLKGSSRDLPGGPVTGAPRSQYSGPRFDPGLESKIPHAETTDTTCYSWGPAQTNKY